MSTSKTAKLSLIATATVAATIALPATAHADESDNTFYSPSGNILCSVGIPSSGSRFSGKAIVYCDIRDYTWTASDCGSGGPADTFKLRQGEQASVMCDPTRDSRTKQHLPGTADLFPPGLPTLDYGQTRSAGPITCDSEPAGVTCTDSTTGHFFRVSRDSYELGR